MIDFTGGALKDKEKNIFADVIERRKDEGDVHTIFFPKRGKQDPAVTWAARGLRVLVVIIALAMILTMLFFLKRGGKESPNLPKSGAKRAPAGEPPGSGNAVGRPPEGTPRRPGLIAGAPLPAAGEGEPRGAPAPESSPPAGPSSAARDLIEKSKVRFRSLLPEFEPLKRLDGDIIHNPMDPLATPWIADIKGEFEVVMHVYRYLRTYKPAELAARADPEVTHGQFVSNPEFHRGTIVNMRVMLLKKGEILGWPKNDSGVLDTTVLYCMQASPGRTADIFVVLVPEPPWKFRERDLYQFTGVFIKRHAYINNLNKWEWHPLLLTTTMKPAPVTRKEFTNITLIIVAVVVAAMIVLYFAVRGETRESEEKRRERLDRRKQGRTRLKQQIESARFQAAKEPKEPGEPEGDEGREGSDPDLD